MGFDEEVKQTKKKVDKKEEPENRYLVVKELPTQQVRQSLDEETNINTVFVTQEEALTKIFEKLIGGDL